MTDHILDDISNACWLWSGVINYAGYGQVKYKGKQWRVHRLMFSLAYPEIPLSHKDHICHICDIRNCFNPLHLFKGTASDNQKDCVAKKRHWQTKRTHCRKGHEFTSENTILEKRSSGNLSRRCKTCTKLKETLRKK
ncbi:MAG TPA: HNH endonuclease [Candidatus Saccharimonadales bacterium]|jgi:hypothetical protein